MDRLSLSDNRLNLGFTWKWLALNFTCNLGSDPAYIAVQCQWMSTCNRLHLPTLGSQLLLPVDIYWHSYWYARLSQYLANSALSGYICALQCLKLWIMNQYQVLHLAQKMARNPQVHVWTVCNIKFYSMWLSDECVVECKKLRKHKSPDSV